MSEENTADAESETPEVSPAENFIDAITAKDYVAASKEFEEMMLSKIDTSMEQEKINLAGQIFNGETPPEDEDDDEEEDHIENDYDEEEEDLDDDTEEDSEEWDEDESNKRIDIIGQNGNDGLHYDQEDEEDESEYDEEEDLDDEEEVEK
tara:strand:+ start:397 stop:846 length:450 start_codon:yes stop_codon:yes gene_type:complete